MAVEKRYEISFMFRRVLVPVDGSENSYKALELALDFALRYGSKIDVIYVSREGEEDLGIRGEVIKRASERRVQISFIHKKYDPNTSSVSTEILKTLIEGGYDAVVLGARGKSINEDLNLGSVALSIVINAPANIVIVR
ncbi:MAG: universal stress protein [Sulfolobales archaeon]